MPPSTARLTIRGWRHEGLSNAQRDEGPSSTLGICALAAPWPRSPHRGLSFLKSGFRLAGIRTQGVTPFTAGHSIHGGWATSWRAEPPPRPAPPRVVCLARGGWRAPSLGDVENPGAQLGAALLGLGAVGTAGSHLADAWDGMGVQVHATCGRTTQRGGGRRARRAPADARVGFPPRTAALVARAAYPPVRGRSPAPRRLATPFRHCAFVRGG